MSRSGPRFTLRLPELMHLIIPPNRGKWMVWVELLVALFAGGMGACFSVAIAAIVSRKRRERPKTNQLPFVESVQIAVDDVHLAEVGSMRHDMPSP
jgi:hypothetical protein